MPSSPDRDERDLARWMVLTIVQLVALGDLTYMLAKVGHIL